MKEVTASKRFFCSKECLDHKGCNSFAYLTTATTGNCQLSTSVDGVSVGGDVAAEIYKKVPTEPKVSAIIAVIVIMIAIVIVTATVADDDDDDDDDDNNNDDDDNNNNNNNNTSHNC